MTATVQPGIRRAQEVAYQKATSVLYAWPERDGILEDPSAATVDIYHWGESTTPTIAAAAVTEGTDHRLSYTLDATNITTWPLGMSARAEFNVTTVSGAPFVIVRPFRIVRVPMVHVPPLRQDDLFNAHRGAKQTLTNAGITNPESFIYEAWEDCLGWCEQHGKVPGFIGDSDNLVPYLRARSRQLMFRALRSAPGENYAELEAEYAKEWERAVINPPPVTYDPVDARAPEVQTAWAQPRLSVSGRDHSKWMWP